VNLPRVDHQALEAAVPLLRLFWTSCTASPIRPPLPLASDAGEACACACIVSSLLRGSRLAFPVLPPGLTLLDILGEQISLDRCLQSLSLPRCCCGRHHRPLRIIALCFCQPTGPVSPVLAARARALYQRRPLAAHCNLSTSTTTTSTAFAFTPPNHPPCKADRTPSTHIFCTSSVSSAVRHLQQTHRFLTAQSPRAAPSCRRFSLIAFDLVCLTSHLALILRRQATLCRPEQRDPESRYLPLFC
jgi:hypothetical protein